MAVAYGLFALGLVLGWSALFLRGPTWSAVVGLSLWLAAIVATAILSPEPRAVAAGALAGALMHLMLQLGLEARPA